MVEVNEETSVLVVEEVKRMVAWSEVSSEKLMRIGGTKDFDEIKNCVQGLVRLGLISLK
jgi:hypothetical protein